MKSSYLRVSLALALAGSASLALAQSSSQAQMNTPFSIQFAELQAQQSSGGNWKPRPQFNAAPVAPAPKLTESYMQSLSKDSAIYQPKTAKSSQDQLPADPADSAGLTVDDLQAMSSDSPVYANNASPDNSVASNLAEGRMVAASHVGKVTSQN
jgi:hypothetical protein